MSGGDKKHLPAPLEQHGLVVMIAGASGLRNADESEDNPNDLSDPYCVCEVVGKHRTKFSTAVVQDSLTPVWNHVQVLNDFKRGETLSFEVWDEDEGKEDDLLGNVTLHSKDVYPFGFVGRLRLNEAGTTAEGKNIKAHLFVAVLPLPLCIGEMQVTKYGNLEPRFFVLLEDKLVYFAERSDYERGRNERGRIMLTDIDSVVIGGENCLELALQDQPYLLRIQAADFREAQQWGAALERALMLRGVDAKPGANAFAAYFKMPYCEGVLGVVSESGKDEDMQYLYCILYADRVVFFRNHAAYRNNEKALSERSMGDIEGIEMDSEGLIRVKMNDQDQKFRASSWNWSRRWGESFKKAMDAQGRKDKVNWMSFSNQIVREGYLQILRDNSAKTRYFVLFPNRMEYYATVEDFKKNDKARIHGQLKIDDFKKIILGNDKVITINVTQGVVQLAELDDDPGQSKLWAEALDQVLQMRGSGATVTRLRHSANNFDLSLFVSGAGIAKSSREGSVGVPE